MISPDAAMAAAGVSAPETDHLRPLKHTQVGVDLEEARKAQLGDGRFVVEGGQEVRTCAIEGKRLLLLHPDDQHVHCSAMAAFFLRSKDSKDPVSGFFDALGYKYTYTTPYVKDNGVWVRGYYSRKEPENSDGKDLDTPNNHQGLTREHEEVIELLNLLIPLDLVGAMRACTCPTHAESTASAALHPDWAQGVARLHKAFSIPVGSGLRVQKGYRWEPDENKRDYYVLDLAVLRDLSDGKVELVLAIEVQQTHANSSKKREAFKEHDIPNVQISAPEVQSKCGPGLAFAGSGQRLEVNDYPRRRRAVVAVPAVPGRAD